MIICLQIVSAQDKIIEKMYVSEYLQSSPQKEENTKIEFTQYPKHEVKFSLSEEIFPGIYFTGHFTYSLSYYYRYKKWLWFGVNINALPYKNWIFNGYNGEIEIETGLYKSKDYLHISLTPSIRLSYLNNPYITLYSALETGIGANVRTNIPNNKIVRVSQFTLFGFSVGKKFFVGGEIGNGHKGFGFINAGYRF